MIRLLAFTLAIGLAVTGCNSPAPRLNAPPHGAAETVSTLQGTFTYMTDNALLEDMSMSDIHFRPHRAQLNQLGEQRLSRLASLMEAYGGDIRFSTNLEDEELIDQRMQNILDFLTEAGLDTTTDTVQRGMAGGRGIDSRDVILIKLNEAGYQPNQSEGSSESLLGGGR